MKEQCFETGKILIIFSLFIELTLIPKSDYIMTCGMSLIDVLIIILVGAGTLYLNHFLYKNLRRYYLIAGIILGLPNVFLGVIISSVIC
ncbi:MAG: hypothetical protein H6557_00665 [Lewinellaceae bacterium]|nr:hypothetical protein [Phaeodactylibacter sp.]MCB9035111.1 hypothetical protein [Lewinellaceae bacterium]